MNKFKIVTIYLIAITIFVCSVYYMCSSMIYDSANSRIQSVLDDGNSSYEEVETKLENQAKEYIKENYKEDYINLLNVSFKKFNSSNNLYEVSAKFKTDNILNEEFYTIYFEKTEDGSFCCYGDSKVE